MNNACPSDSLALEAWGHLRSERHQRGLIDFLGSATVRRLRALLDEREDIALVITDPDGAVFWANPAYTAALVGVTPDECLGQSIEDFVHPDDRQHLRALREGAIASDDTVEHTVRVRSATRRWVEHRIVGWIERTRARGIVVIAIAVPMTAPTIDVSGWPHAR